MNKYSGFLLATAGSAVAMAGGAHAADLMPAKGPTYAPPPPPAASWTGFYLGVNVGAASERVNVSMNGYQLGNPSDNAFIGGGQIGYNWQDGIGVYGIEVDASGLTHGPTVAGLPGKGNALESSINWLVTVRPRLGLAFGNTMVYATGGLAVGHVKNTASYDGINSGNPVKSDSKTRVGWTIGGGVEHMFTPHWTVAAEALYVDLGSNSVTGTTKTGTFSNTAVIGRVKLNYKF